MSKHVLIVDDSKVVRKFIHNILEELKLSHSEAEDGEIALEACRTRMPDIVLMDWNMPVMDGLTSVRKIRSLPGGDKPIVIFCTTENDLSKIQQAIEAGANEYIMKPFDKTILSGKFEQLGLM